MLDGPAPVLEVLDVRAALGARDGSLQTVNRVSFSRSAPCKTAGRGGSPPAI